MAEEFAGQQVDLYDYEVMKIEQEIMPEIARRFYYKASTQENLDEMTKHIVQAFFDLGLVVRVNTAEAYLGVGPPKIEIMSRVSGHSDNKYGHDHERKQSEVLDSRELGEKYRGEKFKHKG